MSGEGLPLIGRLLGHSRHRTTAGYAHLADAHLVEAAEKVGAIIAAAMTSTGSDITPDCPSVRPSPARQGNLTGRPVPATVLDSAAPCASMKHRAHPAMPSKHRVSLNLAPEEYREIAALAEHARVSKAWIGRQALIEFLERYRDRDLQLPLDLAITPRGGGQT